MKSHRNSYSLDRGIEGKFGTLFSIQKSIDLIEKKESIRSTEEESLDSSTCDFVKKRWWRPYLGLFYTLLSSVLLMLTSFFVKDLIYVSSGQLTLMRNIGVLIGSIPLTIVGPTEVLGPRKYWVLLVLRSFSLASSMYLGNMAYKLLPMAETAIILSTMPTLVTVGAYFFLKESFGFVQISCIILTILGVLLSVHVSEVMSQQPNEEFTTDHIVGLGSAFGSVATLSLSYLCLKKMSDVHFAVTLFYFGIIGSIENAALTAVFDTYTWPDNWWDTIEMLLIAIFGFLGHLFVVLSVQSDTAVGVLTTSRAGFDIIVAILFDGIFFGLIPSIYRVGGGVVVIVSVVILALWKWLQNQPEDSIHRKRLKWLLL